jgi:hypothetical protein
MDMGSQLKFYQVAFPTGNLTLSSVIIYYIIQRKLGCLQAKPPLSASVCLPLQ